MSHALLLLVSWGWKLAKKDTKCRNCAAVGYQEIFNSIVGPPPPPPPLISRSNATAIDDEPFHFHHRALSLAPTLSLQSSSRLLLGPRTAARVSMLLMLSLYRKTINQAVETCSEMYSWSDQMNSKAPLKVPDEPAWCLEAFHIISEWIRKEEEEFKMEAFTALERIRTIPDSEITLHFNVWSDFEPKMICPGAQSRTGCGTAPTVAAFFCIWRKPSVIRSELFVVRLSRVLKQQQKAFFNLQCKYLRLGGGGTMEEPFKPSSLCCCCSRAGRAFLCSLIVKQED